jgi:hypothetical protein
MRDFINIVGLLETEHDGDAYFDQETLARAKNQTKQSRDILIHMDPEVFLKMAMSGYDETKMARVQGLFDSGTKFSDIPFLGFVHDGEGSAVVTGHEGRHRARALIKAGVKSMPVLLGHRYDENGQSMRWGSVNDDGPDRFRDEWPRDLYGQRGDDSESDENRYNRIDFPVKRD